jgi:hypothetical protein
MSRSNLKQQAPASLPLAKAGAPTISRNVVVRTPATIGGQHEHAAIITRVIDGDLIDVMMFPAGEDAYRVPSIHHVDSPDVGTISWRWPSGA